MCPDRVLNPQSEYLAGRATSKACDAEVILALKFLINTSQFLDSYNLHKGESILY